MKVQLNLVGQADQDYRELPVEKQFDLWVEMDSIPREGDVVDLPDISQGQTIVRTVVWYPFGCNEYEVGEDMHGVPFVYLVIGNPRL